MSPNGIKTGFSKTHAKRSGTRFDRKSEKRFERKSGNRFDRKSGNRFDRKSFRNFGRGRQDKTVAGEVK